MNTISTTTCAGLLLVLAGSSLSAADEGTTSKLTRDQVRVSRELPTTPCSPLGSREATRSDGSEVRAIEELREAAAKKGANLAVLDPAERTGTTVKLLARFYACTSETDSLLSGNPAVSTAQQARDSRAARRLEIGGVIATAVGSASLVIGAVALGTNSSSCRNASGEECRQIGAASSIALLGAGAGLVAIGIPLWAVGQSRESALRRHHVELSVKSDGARSGAAQLSMRF